MKRQLAFRPPVTPDDLVRHALAAYYRSVAEATAPIADPDPARWSDPEQFLVVLFDFLELRLRCEAAQQGHPVESEPARYACWMSHPPHRDQHIRDVNPGLWAEMCIKNPALLEPAAPASMAHGCAALKAVGTAPALSVVADEQRGRSASDITHPANPLFCDPAVQRLQRGGDASPIDQGGTP